ncbi:hypothetical protein GUJ93_ZPchr0010g10447 [Zizania palustris]|uniref:UTP25 NTP hydrolase-like domain-containing protein n=1 Tax=Zizania palustris TaxID=103762 RepID=A0A8J5W8V8_ZIZPA|nr:hypothetical protein GUJ93_ZPchr0010g10447 [Zizania palustris]
MVLGSACMLLSQTILLSSYLTPEMNALFNGLCLNYEGKVKLTTEYKGVLSKIQFEAPQVYERFDASSITEADDARFDHFCRRSVLLSFYGMFPCVARS